MELGQTYHIYNHANGDEQLFREYSNYIFFLDKFKSYIHPIADIYAYCLMPYHFHFLLKVKDQEELKDLSGFQNLTGLSAYEKQISKSFSNHFNSYAKAYNKRVERRGSLFERRFKAKQIKSVDQWQETFLYIHLNPIKHGFTQNLKLWKWSSWHAYKSINYKSLLDRNEALSYFDNIENLLYCSEDKLNRLINMSLE
ncbi:transposase [Marivirga sp.]|uniref:transposase n=1 Tax=Marivirga sp. TaxID=2018662 RepID=UPI0025DD2C9E|nr:transposase [Marivirga sp.]